MPIHASDSSEQQAAETHLINSLAVELGVSVISSDVYDADGAHMKVDGYSSEHRVLAEAFSRHGDFKSAQRHKVATDVLKLVFLEQTLGGTWRKYLCFADEAACASLLGKSWLAHAIRKFGIEIRVYPLPPAERLAVLEAQKRQVMVNAP